MDLKKFKKLEKVSNLISTTVRITQEQREFIDKHNLNLSRIVRNRLQTMIDKVEIEENKDKGEL